MRVLKTLEGRPAGLVVVLSLLTTLLVALADYASGPELSSAIFYVIPVGIAAWFGNRMTGLAVSVVAAVGWLWADQTGGAAYTHAVIPWWNAAVRLVLFVVLVELIAAQRRQLRAEQVRAGTDALTGCHNTRAFYEHAHREIDRARRYHHPFSVAYIDFDNFKHINDAYGHAAGDVLLRRAAAVMRECTRDTDVVARLGGDEFVVLFVETGETAARRAAGELQQRLNKQMEDAGWPVTLSIGLVTYETPPVEVREMLNEADQLMYAVKRHGKNSIEHAVVGFPSLAEAAEAQDVRDRQ